MTVQHKTMPQVTILTMAEDIYYNLVTSIVQDIVSRATSQNQFLNARYPNNPTLNYDPNGKLDIYGRQKQQESSIYFRCNNCDRDISANRFAAHLERCMSRGGRRG
ncbi:HHL189Cp [Eremothecium sinecaudum]|uniref:SAGA-associated factor 11 n=1 Tax=Eremothecium sinecaudum TaxID=45286 RepID=A0A0X8HW35_9SACH|nr:HHL189Cp [Eremothecium sinecaudum]AMD22581.1 HHL189Cp [Eremothecium sinecaudum]